jgi:hypothetical protein
MVNPLINNADKVNSFTYLFVTTRCGRELIDHVRWYTYNRAQGNKAANSMGPSWELVANVFHWLEGGHAKQNYTLKKIYSTQNI